jgi:hypothetical protein
MPKGPQGQKRTATTAACIVAILLVIALFIQHETATPRCPEGAKVCVFYYVGNNNAKGP